MSVLQRFSITLIFVVILTGCSSLPDQVIHQTSLITANETSPLYDLTNSYWLDKDIPETSAVLIQDDGWNALAQRLALIETAKYSIDIQYYIWNSDNSGLYLAQRLKAAADRGVKVRVMLDDINLNQRENVLAKLDNHPHIDIRIFNPTPSRDGLSKWLSFVGDFSRLNRRMHNKSFTVDGVLSVVGGRNIGDEYFDLSDEINFRDRDALVMGSAVSEIQTSFAAYWDSRWSYPINLLTDNTSVELSAIPLVKAPHYQHYPPLPQDNESANLFLHALIDKLIPVEATFIYDLPVPVNSSNTDTPKKTAKLLAELGHNAQQQILIESAYLIFDKRQLAALKILIDNDIQIKALTNSMASNDLLANHSGYAGKRHAMLKNGIQLFELKPESELCEVSTKDIDKCVPNVAFGLHAKSAVFDRKIATIGSFNFNLRSTYLNTESVLVINNEQVANTLADHIEQAMQENNSWQLNLENGDIYWRSGTQSWTSDPETGQWERIKSKFIQLLPIEKYL